MERSIGMLIFQAICYSEEATIDPPLLFSILCTISNPLLTRNLRTITQFESHTSICCIFHVADVNLVL